MSSPEILYMVVPCYNEQEVLHETAKQLGEKYESLIKRNLISPESRIVFVNDGSKDKTWEIIQELHKNSPNFFSGINLAHNSGHQNAVLSGLMTVKDICDMCITMDADLQDDINTIDAMVEKYYEGNQVVYGVRSARDTDTFFKKFTAESFYKFMAVMGADVVYNHADFRLMSKRVLQELANFKEVNLFLRGMVPLIGFQSCSVYYERHERFAGESKYPLKKNACICDKRYYFIQYKASQTHYYSRNIDVGNKHNSYFVESYCKIGGFSESGWSSTMCSIWLIGGLQLFCLGIIGEYVGKIYAEVKQRPRYIIDKFINNPKKFGK